MQILEQYKQKYKNQNKKYTGYVQQQNRDGRGKVDQQVLYNLNKRKRKIGKKNEQNLWDLYNNIKRCDNHIIRIIEEEEKEYDTSKFLEKDG